MLVTNGADVNARNNEEQTPLLIASASGQLNVARVQTSTPASLFHVKDVQMLVETAADKEMADANGWTPLLVAADEKQFEIMKVSSSCPEICWTLIVD